MWRFTAGFQIRDNEILPEQESSSGNKKGRGNARGIVNINLLKAVLSPLAHVLTCVNLFDPSNNSMK